MITVAEAIVSLNSTLKFKIIDDAIHWQTGIDETNTAEYSGSPSYSVPTQAEIDAEVIRLQVVYDAQDYARKRKAKYDALNQFELISDDSINGTTTHKDAILAIKSEFPKP